MKKEIQCKECNNTLIVECYCDTCSAQLTNDGHFTYEVGKPTIIELRINGTEYEFCNWKCLLKFVIEEIKKTNLRAEFGKEK